MLELINQLEGKRLFDKVPNFLYYEDGTVRATKTHVENVEELPTPDFEGLPLHDYLTPLPVLPIWIASTCALSREFELSPTIPALKVQICARSMLS